MKERGSSPADARADRGAAAICHDRGACARRCSRYNRRRERRGGEGGAVERPLRRRWFKLMLVPCLRSNGVLFRERPRFVLRARQGSTRGGSPTARTAWTTT